MNLRRAGPAACFEANLNVARSTIESSNLAVDVGKFTNNYVNVAFVNEVLFTSLAALPLSPAEIANNVRSWEFNATTFDAGVYRHGPFSAFDGSRPQLVRIDATQLLPKDAASNWTLPADLMSFTSLTRL